MSKWPDNTLTIMARGFGVPCPYKQPCQVTSPDCIRSCTYGANTDTGVGYSKEPGPGLDDVYYTVICRHPDNPNAKSHKPDTVVDISGVL